MWRHQFVLNIVTNKRKIRRSSVRHWLVIIIAYLSEWWNIRGQYSREGRGVLRVSMFCGVRYHGRSPDSRGPLAASALLGVLGGSQSTQHSVVKCRRERTCRMPRVLWTIGDSLDRPHLYAQGNVCQRCFLSYRNIRNYLLKITNTRWTMQIMFIIIKIKIFFPYPSSIRNELLSSVNNVRSYLYLLIGEPGFEISGRGWGDL